MALWQRVREGIPCISKSKGQKIEGDWTPECDPHISMRAGPLQQEYWTPTGKTLSVLEAESIEPAGNYLAKH